MRPDKSLRNRRLIRVGLGYREAERELAGLLILFHLVCGWCYLRSQILHHSANFWHIPVQIHLPLWRVPGSVRGAHMCLLYFSGPLVKPMEVSSRTSMSVWLRPVSSQNRYCSLHLAGWHLGRSTSGQPSSQGTHRPPGPPLSLLKSGFTSVELVQRGCFFTSVDKALQVHQDLFPQLMLSCLCVLGHAQGPEPCQEKHMLSW